MTTAPKNRYFWQGDRIRLRLMHMNDADLWLAEERSDSEAVRFLNCGMDLPKSEHAAQAFTGRYFGDLLARLESEGSKTT